jgi:serine/threonine protein kinase
MLPSAPPLTSQSLLDRAYEEYCSLARSGHSVDTDEFLGRYPIIQSSLARLLRFHHEVESEQNPLPSEWPAVGSVFCGFHLVAKLGDGAFSRVYLARESALGHRRVALKVTRRTIAEAYTQGRLSHPNIMPLLTAFEDESSRFSVICMPYLGSATLGTLLDAVLDPNRVLRDGGLLFEAARDVHADGKIIGGSQRKRISFEDAVRRMFAEICGALDFLHEQRIVHRDLKPTNVLLTPDGSPILMDFNLAQDPTNPETHFGGTYLYMSPEQLKLLNDGHVGSADAVDRRSDLFAVGVMLWQVLIGDHPFGPFAANCRGAELRALLRARHAIGFRPDPSKGKELSKNAIALVRRCLATDPAERPATAVELQRLLEPKPARSAKLVRRVLLGVVATTLVLGAFWSTSKWIGQIDRPHIDATESFRGCYAKGVAAFDAHRYREAIGCFDEAVKAVPKDYRGWYGRAAATLREGARDPETLAAAMSDALTADSLQSDARTAELAGYASQRAEKDTVAELGYRKALQRGGSTVATNNNLGAILVHSPQYREALPFLDEALRQNPGCVPARFNRAYCRIRCVQPSPKKPLSARERGELLKAAYDDLIHASNREPDQPALHVYLALVQARQSKTDPSLAKKAAEHLDRALKAGYSGNWFGDDPDLMSLLDNNPALREKLSARRLNSPAPIPSQAPTASDLDRLVAPNVILPPG